MNLLQIVAAETLNESAEEINKNYKIRLKKNAKLRNKFSLNSVKIFKANPISKSGKPRKINKLNAIVGVRKMKGGKEHYLKKLEDGGTTRGNPLTRGKVPIPLKTARIGGNDNRAISSINRLTKSKTQTLQIRGRKIGVSGDGYTKRQRWGALYSASRRGIVTGDTKKPFYMIDNRNKLGIFKQRGKKIKKIRNLDKNSVRRKAEPHFQRSVKQMSPKRMQQRFIKNAKRKLGK